MPLSALPLLSPLCRRPFALAAGALCLALGAATFTAPAAAQAKGQLIGTVDTAFILIGRDHDIAVEAYDDPAVQGVSCYVSRARTGGIKGSLGLAEDRAEASISCRQVGPVRIDKELPLQEQVFSERMSILFKRLRVVRMVDVDRNTLVYLTYSDKLIDGSPQNSVTAVPIDRAMPIPVKK
ncbi:MAG: CreA family protein [Comamonadaceae bacterium]|nr:CreA family protein [Comamonadaceae bacterium]